MRKSILGCVLVSSLALVGSSSVHAQFFTSNFDSAGEVANYNVYTSGAATGTPPTSPSAAGQFQFSETLGRLGGGGLIHTASGATDIAAVYQPSLFDLTAFDPLTIAGFFLTSTDPAPPGGGAIFQGGFSANNTTALYGEAGNSFISSRINKTGSNSNSFRMQTQVKVSGGGTSAVDLGPGVFSLEGDTWYRMSLTVTRSATANTFNFSTVLENWGPTGASFVSVAVGPFTGSFVNAELYNDSSAYAAFRAQEGKSVAALDSFSVIPEPGTALLLAPAFAMMLGPRARRSAR